MFLCFYLNNTLGTTLTGTQSPSQKNVQYLILFFLCKNHSDIFHYLPIFICMKLFSRISLWIVQVGRRQALIDCQLQLTQDLIKASMFYKLNVLLHISQSHAQSQISLHRFYAKDVGKDQKTFINVRLKTEVQFQNFAQKRARDNVAWVSRPRRKLFADSLFTIFLKHTTLRRERITLGGINYKHLKSLWNLVTGESFSLLSVTFMRRYKLSKSWVANELMHSLWNFEFLNLRRTKSIQYIGI